MMLLSSVKKFIVLGKKLLDGRMQSDDFKLAFYDLYRFEIKSQRTESKVAQKIFYAFENFNEIVSFYCSLPKLRAECNLLIDEKKLARYTENFIKELDEYLKKFGSQNCTIIKPKYLSDTTIKKLEYIILMSNRLLGLRLEKEDLLKIFSKFLASFEPETEQEYEIRKTIEKYLKKFKNYYKHDKKSNSVTIRFLKKPPTLYENLLQTKKDPITASDPFIESLNELKEILYFYLNSNHNIIKVSL